VLIDAAISGDRNVIKKEAERIIKYKNLTRDSQHMWNVNTKVIPIIIGANGTKDHSGNNRAPFGRARNQGTTENCHIEHCSLSSGSTDIKVQNVYHGKYHYV